jgi:hypothetical protein
MMLVRDARSGGVSADGNESVRSRGVNEGNERTTPESGVQGVGPDESEREARAEAKVPAFLHVGGERRNAAATEVASGTPLERCDQRPAGDRACN